jgi:hypothetical protein
MWWDPSEADFAVGSTITRGLGRLKTRKFSQFLPPINQLVQQCTELRRTSLGLAFTLFGELTQHILMLVQQLETLPTTFIKMVFAVTSLQRAFLELDALYWYMTVYKARMNDYYQAPHRAETSLAQVVDAFTTVPTVAQQLWAAYVPVWFLRPVKVFDRENILDVVALREPQFNLPDPHAHGIGAPPVLYSGNSTVEKIAAIQRAAIQTPWYQDPFENSVTRARSPSPDPDAATATVVASTSRSVLPPRVSRQLHNILHITNVTPAIPLSTGSRETPPKQQRYKLCRSSVATTQTLLTKLTLQIPLKHRPRRVPLSKSGINSAWCRPKKCRHPSSPWPMDLP